MFGTLFIATKDCSVFNINVLHLFDTLVVMVLMSMTMPKNVMQVEGETILSGFM